MAPVASGVQWPGELRPEVGVSDSLQPMAGTCDFLQSKGGSGRSEEWQARKVETLTWM
ncbi:hypothetical protein LV75_005554 [Actinokineospora diospyrosa]|uniref:Uncharacterized protein n=1 Tax=Actinokineospora diospyrosa TaxID=103728 RepID=A0ABT1IK54_9PSEU|nr:hypothetical protein [Actinokineospora diospyrosa]